MKLSGSGSLLVGCLGILLAATQAEAQQLPAVASRDDAFVLNGGPMIGVLGGGLFGRINPEFQIHKKGRYGGHAFNVGVAVAFWPNEGGPSFSFAPRYQYDHQLVEGAPLYVSPFVGVDLGMGVFDLFTNAMMLRPRFVLSPMAGVDIKFIINQRFLIGFRPIGLTVPLFIGGMQVTGDVIYDLSFSLGVTY